MRSRVLLTIGALILGGCMVGVEPTGPTIGTPPIFTPPRLFALVGKVRRFKP